MSAHHAEQLLEMAEQLEQPFWTGPTGADAALVEQAKVLRAAAAHLQRETKARQDAQRELAELREKYLALGVRVTRAEQDSKRIDWLADKDNHIGNVMLPTECVERNLHSLRAAIDDAMHHFEGARGMVEPEMGVDND